MGIFRELREDSTGAFYSIEPLARPYVDDVVAAARAGTLGGSWRLAVEPDVWLRPDRPSPAKPRKLDERTIAEAKLYEAGPVTFGANPAASAGVRSGDELADQLNDRRRTTQAERLARLEELDIAGGSARVPWSERRKAAVEQIHADKYARRQRDAERIRADQRRRQTSRWSA